MGTNLCLLFTIQTWLHTVSYRLRMHKPNEQRYPTNTIGALSSVVLTYCLLCARVPLVKPAIVFGSFFQSMCRALKCMACLQQVLSVCRQLVECGYENLWYMRQCVQCDATHGAIELAARVSAILQVIPNPFCVTC